MFDGKNFGYVAIGDMIVFRALVGGETEIMRVPEDVDSHVLAQALNDSLNAIIAVAAMLSQYKF